jgi:MoxR-like ATPase
MKLDYAPLQRDLAEVGYIADEALAMALCLMIGLGRPLLIEGEAGVGKTEIGKALAQVLETRLIRLQCYEGLANATLYEWNYQRQLSRSARTSETRSLILMPPRHPPPRDPRARARRDAI